MTRRGATLAALLLGTGCSYQGTPVPVAGDTNLLAGEWDGTYSSQETGRAGSIIFHLKAGTDSAYGDVLMIYTTFEGRLKGNTFKGTFVTLYPGSGHRAAGKWSVERKQK